MTGTGAKVGAAIVAALLPGVASAEQPWRELTSEHFVVRTNLHPKVDDDLVTTLEETRAAMLAVVWNDAPGPSGRTPVIALASQAELAQFTNWDAIGKYVYPSPFPSTLVFGGFATDEERATAKHELAHHLGNWFLPTSPHWYNEGLALFLQTIRYDRREERVYVGEPALDEHARRVKYGPSPKAELFGRQPRERRAYARFAASSWTLFHYLVNNRYPAFERFQRRLGRLEPLEKGWAAEFPDLDAKRLHTELDGYPAVGVRSLKPKSVPRWRGQPVKRSMSSPEVHATLALLSAFVTPNGGLVDQARVRRELDAALAADATAIEALTLKFYVPDMAGDQSLEKIAQLAVKAHPGNWLAWLMTADAAADPRGAHATNALARALTLAPDQPEALHRLAGMRILDNQGAEALTLSTKALGVRSVTERTLILHLTALSVAGKCREAEAWYTALVEYLPKEHAQIISAAHRTLQMACSLAKPGIPNCPTAAARDGRLPLFDPTPRPSGETAPFWQTVLDRVGPKWQAIDVWRLIDPEGWLYQRTLLTMLVVAVDTSGKIKTICRETSSGVDLVDVAGFTALQEVGSFPVPPAHLLKGSSQFNARIPLGFTFNAGGASKPTGGQ